MFIPSLILKQLYTFGSLKNTDEGVEFSLKNRLSDATITGLTRIKLAGIDVALSDVRVEFDDGNVFTPAEINDGKHMAFPLRRSLKIKAAIDHLSEGKHPILLAFEAKPFGKLKLKVEGDVSAEVAHVVRMPRNPVDDYSETIIKERQDFVERFTGKKLDHLRKYSFDPHITAGNIENFTGVAQVPIGFAGPLQINGDFAKGEFMVPLATTEGTLVASYNRGMKVLNMSGGVTCTIVGDAMQRAPVFVFENAKGGRMFVDWVNENLDNIREQAESTSTVAHLKYVDYYLSNKFAYLRFNYTTGDAAGQNMVGKATFAACRWIIDNYPGDRGPIKKFYLESNFATDKKASMINIMRTRGKRVTAEAVIKREILTKHMRVEPENLVYHAGVANIGSMLSGANNNGLHSANGITAMFIATGQDVANVAESSAAVIYSEVTPEKDLYLSITLPSLIVASYGGGVNLATQKECLELLGCYGKGGVNKLAEIIAGVVLAGEISLACAISSADWVSSHERYGRNR